MGNLRRLRLLSGKTQAETARTLGVSEDTVARREVADEELSLKEVRILADFFGCEEAEFLKNPKNPTLPPVDATRPGKRKRKTCPEPVKRARGKRSVA